MPTHHNILIRPVRDPSAAWNIPGELLDGDARAVRRVHRPSNVLGILARRARRQHGVEDGVAPAVRRKLRVRTNILLARAQAGHAENYQRT